MRFKYYLTVKAVVLCPETSQRLKQHDFICADLNAWKFAFLMRNNI